MQVQNRIYSLPGLIRDLLVVCGNNYNSAYFRLLEEPISDCIWQIQQWEALQKLISPPKPGTPRSMGISDDDYEVWG